jgi:hypothetical protein
VRLELSHASVQSLDSLDLARKSRLQQKVLFNQIRKPCIWSFLQIISKHDLKIEAVQENLGGFPVSGPLIHTRIRESLMPSLARNAS